MVSFSLTALLGLLLDNCLHVTRGSETRNERYERVGRTSRKNLVKKASISYSPPCQSLFTSAPKSTSELSDGEMGGRRGAFSRALPFFARRCCCPKTPLEPRRPLTCCFGFGAFLNVDAPPETLVKAGGAETGFFELVEAVPPTRPSSRPIGRPKPPHGEAVPT
ncbi:hypothetical protein BJY59DRAFT_593438 [Rhodotorula toruloides]